MVYNMPVSYSRISSHYTHSAYVYTHVNGLFLLKREQIFNLLCCVLLSNTCTYTDGDVNVSTQ